ncbi:MAG: site-specific DNA-methyltransferase, partial [Ignavibacteriae bacterium]|nr:site-specific DNA-methyltransferase [Ignavibacteriota bacterium]
MPIKYVPFFPDTVEGQAILNNFTRTRRYLKYRDNDKVFDNIRRGMPYYEVEKVESVGSNPKNMVIRGECISACAFLKEQEIKVDLVYIDPPFASGADYAKKVYIRGNQKVAEAIKKAEEELDVEELRSFEEKMYGDIWNKESYLNWMYDNLLAIKSVMSDTASIYVHLDWHIGHYVKILMDEVFGEDFFKNEIIWAYRRWTALSNTFQNSHDLIFWYSLNDCFIWNQIFEPYADKEAHFSVEDDKGKYRWQYLKGKKYKLYLQEGIRMKDWWDDIPYINSMANERQDYATQKPETLLERIIKSSSNENMIVADFFGGSGVCAKVANDLNHNFIHVDIGINSIQTTRDRLLSAGAEFDIYEIKDGINLF